MEAPVLSETQKSNLSPRSCFMVASNLTAFGNKSGTRRAGQVQVPIAARLSRQILRLSDQHGNTRRGTDLEDDDTPVSVRLKRGERVSFVAWKKSNAPTMLPPSMLSCPAASRKKTAHRRTMTSGWTSPCHWIWTKCSDFLLHQPGLTAAPIRAFLYGRPARPL
jgi:hypothetical protein